MENLVLQRAERAEPAIWPEGQRQAPASPAISVFPSRLCTQDVFVSFTPPAHIVQIWWATQPSSSRLSSHLEPTLRSPHPSFVCPQPPAQGFQRDALPHPRSRGTRRPGVGVRPRSEQASAKDSPSCRRRSLPRSGPRRGSGGKRAIWVARASPPSSSQPRPVPPPAGGGCWPGLPRSHPEAGGLSPTHPTDTSPRGPLPHRPLWK